MATAGLDKFQEKVGQPEKGVWILDETDRVNIRKLKDLRRSLAQETD